MTAQYGQRASDEASGHGEPQTGATTLAAAYDPAAAGPAPKYKVPTAEDMDMIVADAVRPSDEQQRKLARDLKIDDQRAAQYDLHGMRMLLDRTKTARKHGFAALQQQRQ